MFDMFKHFNAELTYQQRYQQGKPRCSMSCVSTERMRSDCSSVKEVEWSKMITLFQLRIAKKHVKLLRSTSGINIVALLSVFGSRKVHNRVIYIIIPGLTPLPWLTTKGGSKLRSQKEEKFKLTALILSHFESVTESIKFICVNPCVLIFEC